MAFRIDVLGGVALLHWFRHGSPTRALVLYGAGLAALTGWHLLTRRVVTGALARWVPVAGLTGAALYAGGLVPATALLLGLLALGALAGLLVFLARVPPDERAAVRLSHGRSERVVLWAVLGASLVETIALDLVLAGTRFRVPVLVLSLLSLPLLLTAIAKAGSRPHLLFADRLVLRPTAFEVEVPLASLSSVSSSLGMSPGSRTGAAAGVLSLPSGGATDVLLVLDEALATPLGEVERIRLAVDDPREFVRQVSAALGAPC